MAATGENTVLAHWYYSVSEWEMYMKRKGSPVYIKLFAELFLIVTLVTPIIRFGSNISWIISLVIAVNVAIVYAAARYLVRRRLSQWKGARMPEVIITGSAVRVNDEITLFHGKGKMLRKVGIEEKNSANILEIIYEWSTRKGIRFDVVRILIPKGKLREAIGVQDALNLQRDVRSLFS